MLRRGWRCGVASPQPTVNDSSASTNHSSVSVRHLDEAELWGGPIEDERYLVVSTR
jgi:hypothetical protein